MKTTTLFTIALFVVSAIAVPALADPDHADDRKDAAKERASDKAAERDDKRGDHMAQKDERKNATIAKAQERCDAYENRTGRDLPACDRLKEVHDEPKQARRAAHALIKAIDALEHRVVTLEKLEIKFMEKLEGDNLTDNQTAAYEAKLVRIQAAQNKTIEKIEKMEERLEKLKAKWSAVRDHAEGQAKVLVCHEGDDGNHTLRISRNAAAAHVGHGDSLGACPDVDDSALEAESDASAEAASDAPADSEGESEEPEAGDDPEGDSEGDPEDDPEADPADPGA